MPNKIVFIAGSPGAGKSSLLENVAKKGKYKVLNIGTEMMNTAIAKGYAKDRDGLRFATPEQINDLQVTTFQEVSKRKGNIILDTHATVQQNGRYVPGIALQHMKHLHKLVGFIYIDALTKDIVKRRKSDKTRRRENERLELIDVQRLINVSIISACSTYLDVPIYVVFNEEGKLDKSMKQLESHLDDVFGA